MPVVEEALVVISLSQRRVLAVQVAAGLVEALEHHGLACLALPILAVVVGPVDTTQVMRGKLAALAGQELLS